MNEFARVVFILYLCMIFLTTMTREIVLKL